MGPSKECEKLLSNPFAVLLVIKFVFAGEKVVNGLPMISSQFLSAPLTRSIGTPLSPEKRGRPSVLYA